MYHVPVAPVFDSILNPVTGSFPLFDGNTHEICTVSCEISVALTSVGGFGNAMFCCGVEVGGGWLVEPGADDVLVGVTVARGDGLVWDPPDSNAVTAKVYVL